MLIQKKLLGHVPIYNITFIPTVNLLIQLKT